MHLNCELLFEKYAASYLDGASTLEIGPWSVPSRFETLANADSWATADLRQAAYANDHGTDAGDIDFVMPDEYTLSVADESFDVVLSANVIEHVRRPWCWMAELARVTRPGGHVVTINPVSWPYHEAPLDCWRIYPEGMRGLSEHVGLVVELSVCESLEPPRSRRTYPGDGTSGRDRPLGNKARLAHLLGWPLPVALDTITIATKPGR